MGEAGGGHHYPDESGTIPPDGYLEGCRNFVPMIAHLTGIPADTITEYVILFEVTGDNNGVDVIVSPGLDIGQLPTALRDLADGLDLRNMRMLS